jgi:hypothetical protein
MHYVAHAAICSPFPWSISPHVAGILFPKTFKYARPCRSLKAWYTSTFLFSLAAMFCSLSFLRFAVVVLSIGHVTALPISSNEAVTDSSPQSWKRSEAADVKSAWFVLAGDSTTANPPADKGGGGWGRGFLRTLQSPAGGVNYAQNGATTVSFRQDKHWDKVISETKRQSGSKPVYVTIQVSRPFASHEQDIC